MNLTITRSVSEASSPLRHELSTREIGVAYAGYTLHTSLQAHNEIDPGGVALWSLLQLPHGGRMLAPTYGRSKPRVLFGEIAGEALRIGAHGLRYRMDATGAQKLGIRASSVTGRMGYLYQNDASWTLVIRNFFVNPSGDYIDVPWDDPDDPGYCVQACTVNVPPFGAFSELEYHSPAIGMGSGRRRHEEVSQLWAFRGPHEQIKSIADRLLPTNKERDDHEYHG